MPPQTALQLPGGLSLTLRRHATRAQPDNLRAWDAADELTLLHLAEQPPIGPVLVCGDRYGALAAGLAAHDVRWWGDSAESAAAARANLAANNLREPDRWRSAVEPPPVDGAQTAVVRIPRSGAELEDTLTRLAAAMPAGSRVIGAGMTKHVRSAVVDAFESLVGSTVTTKARKKARLILSTTDAGEGATVEPHRRDVDGLQVIAWPGVFAGGRLDPGTELLLTALAHLREALADSHVVDLGCGAGIVGAWVARAHPAARLTFTDDSSRAVQSAQETMAANHPGREASYVHADGLDGVGDASADVVLVNPPFHDGHEVTDAIAWHMFSDARRVLRPGGLLVAVGNQHLGHHAKLGRLYGGSTVVASNPRFVVVSATRM